MKANEIIGVAGIVISLTTIIAFIYSNHNHLLLSLLFFLLGIFIQALFLSLWGLDKFNPWLESKIKNINILK